MLGDEADERGASHPFRRAVLGRELEADRGRLPRPRAGIAAGGARRALDEPDLLERSQVPRAVRRALPHDRRALAGGARAGGEQVVEERETGGDGEGGEGLGADHGAGRQVVAVRVVDI